MSPPLARTLLLVGLGTSRKTAPDSRGRVSFWNTLCTHLPGVPPCTSARLRPLTSLARRRSRGRPPRQRPGRWLETAHGSAEVRRPDRLGEVGIESCGCATRDIARQRRRRERDNRALNASGAELRAERIAVEERHLDVEHDEVKGLLQGPLPRAARPAPRSPRGRRSRGRRERARRWSRCPPRAATAAQASFTLRSQAASR